MIEWIAMASVAGAVASDAPSVGWRAWPINRWCKRRRRGQPLPTAAPFSPRKAWRWSDKEEDMVPNYRALQHTNFYPNTTGLGALFQSPKDRLWDVADELSQAEHWTLWRDFEPEMKIQADSWPVLNLFPELPPWRPRTRVQMFGISDQPPADKRVFSPQGSWSYVNKVLPVGTALPVSMRAEDVDWLILDQLEADDLYDAWRDETVTGVAVFDADILVPTVYEGDTLWMSHTPFEALSQREGIRLANGHVVIGGLGLGWFLLEVLKKPQVKRVTLVEINQELVDWLLPRMCSLLPPRKRVDIIIGDINQVLPHLTADVALLDIWPTYTDIEADLVALRKRVPRKQVRRIWGWGRSGDEV